MLALGSLLGVGFLLGGGYLLKDQIKAFLEFFITAVDQWGVWGVGAYAAVYIALEVLALPGEAGGALTLAALDVELLWGFVCAQNAPAGAAAARSRCQAARQPRSRLLLRGSSLPWGGGILLAKSS